MRQITLGLQLYRVGFAVELACHEIPDPLVKRASDFGLTVRYRPRRQDDATMSGVVDDHDVDVVVFDGYEFDPREISNSRRDGRLSLVVDDNGEFADVDCDLILNQNLFADRSMYATNPHSPELLLGTRWALIRPEISDLARVEHPGPREGVFVSVGGMDPHHRADSLRDVAKLRRNWMVESAGGIAGSGSMSPADMAMRMWVSKVGVVACGTTTWEAACLGLPIVGLVVADNQVRVADSISKAGLGESFDIREDFDPSRILDSVEELYDDDDLVESRSRFARDLVDGSGGERVARRLRDLLDGPSGTA